MGDDMPNVFNVAEIIDMGIEKERKRRDFYGLVAKTFKDKEMADLFAKLKSWEETHIQKFTEIRNSVQESETTQSYEGEFEAYMKATVDDMLYGQVSAKEFSKNVKTQAIAIQYGMGFEKDAIVFFGELLKYMAAPHQEKVQELINEEKKHLIYLAELKRKYT